MVRVVIKGIIVIIAIKMIVVVLSYYVVVIANVILSHATSHNHKQRITYTFAELSAHPETLLDAWFCRKQQNSKRIARHPSKDPLVESTVARVQI